MLNMQHKWIRIAIKLIFLVGLLAALIYLGNVWWLVKYGASPQPVPSEILNVDQGFQFPPGLPPDPGSEGKKTIQGIDSDHDGIRDDVQRWIHAFLPNDKNKQMALRQSARYLQYALSDDYSLEVRKQGNEILDRSIQCTRKVFNDEIHGYMEDMYLQAKVLNTFARVSRYWSNDEKVTTREMSRENPVYENPCDNQ